MRLFVRPNRTVMLAAAALSVGLAASPSTAASLDFTFSFTNVLSNIAGTVTGIVRGLEEGTGPAMSVEIISNSQGFGVGEYVGSPSTNYWTVSGGIVTEFDFRSYAILNTAPAVTTGNLFLQSFQTYNASFRAVLTSDPDDVNTASRNVSTADFGLTFTPVPAPVPLPAAGLMLFVALGGLAAVRRRAA